MTRTRSLPFRSSFNFFSDCVFIQPELLRQFDLTVEVHYDGNPESQSFQALLDIPHHGDLRISHSSRLDAAATLLYSHLPANSAIAILDEAHHLEPYSDSSLDAVLGGFAGR